MGSLLVTVLFWLTVGLIVAALIGEFRDTWAVTGPDAGEAISPSQDAATPG